MEKNLKVLCSGCSFSEPQPYYNEYSDIRYEWKPWTDFLSEESDIDVTNVATGSAGNFRISNSIMTELLDDEKENPDLIIIQWSQTLRGFSNKDDSLVYEVLQQIPEDLSFIGLDYHSQDSIINKFEKSRLHASIQQIILLTNYIEKLNIPYFFFWGWRVLDNDDYLSKITENKNWWSPNNNPTHGMLEYGKMNLKNYKVEDGHASTETQKLFFDKIIIPIIKKSQNFKLI